MSLKAYQDAQQIAEDPRQIEYRLFGQVTGALMKVSRDDAKGRELIETLDWNRRIWQAMSGDCQDDHNRLPAPIRAKIISLALWVARYTRKVVRQHAPIEPLIQVNRSIMQGLQDRG
jgi:flagellar protein FlaF